MRNVGLRYNDILNKVINVKQMLYAILNSVRFRYPRVYLKDRAERHCFFYHDFSYSFYFSSTPFIRRKEKREKE